MTIIMEVKRNNTTEVTLEWEKEDVFYARVYEKIGDWKETHRSNPYKFESDARKSYKRFVNKYLKN